MEKLVTISELCRIINLIEPKTKKPLNYIVRYWEKEFRQINPKKINGRRYYTSKDIETIKMIKFLLKNRKMTITGVKNILKLDPKKLDVDNDLSLKNDYIKKNLFLKSKLLLKKLKNLKGYGKKNTS